MSWEEKFQSWAKPPSESEQEKCDNAERAVRKAIDAGPALENRNICVFPQGSYRHRTNVRWDSDVDICVLCTDTFFFELPNGMTSEDFDFDPATYSYSQYKNEVENALVSYFGRGSVTRGNKAFDVHENTYRVDADAVACFEHRRYHSDGTYLVGTEFELDRGGRIKNWPQQNYDNGVAKNNETNRRFKALVRILKRLRNEMDDEGIAAAKPIPSYLIECLVWNVPNEHLCYPTYTSDVRESLAYLFNNTISFDDCKDWGEINELKYLFRGASWTFEQAHKFLSVAWDYIGFE